ncbi:POTRA domain-containing protein [Polluticoccus soli]|uniref:POTRA domain-containing protein n=1 Tax=Polluticoccus soli TaxID=3034150 RepID=UPI0023E0D7A5|nr:POTRA domain-containing protein [Flavipsychrobacter sp. JY13-12]
MKYFLFLFVFLFACAVSGQENRFVSIPDSVNAVPGKSYHLRSIFITGNKHTRDRVIHREMSVKEGALIPSDSLNLVLDLNQKRIFNLSIFTEATIAVLKVDDSTIDWHIKVTEQWYIIPEISFQLADRNFNVWWKEQERDIRRANIGVTLKHRNFRGNLEQLSATAQIGYTQKFGLEYFKPYVDRRQQHGLGASFFFSKNEEMFFTTNLNKLQFVKTPRNYVISRFEAAAVYVYRPGYATRHLIELRYRDYRVDDTVIKLNPEYYDNGSSELNSMELSYRFDLNKVDNWNYPLVGLKLVGNFISRVGFKGIGFQNTAYVEAAKFYHLGHKWYSSNIVRARVMAPQRQPYAFRSALGVEPDYVRGYEYYVVDGSQFGVLRNSLKYELLNTSIRSIPFKYLPVLPIRLYPKIFADVGYVVNKFPGNSFLNNRLLYAAGFGLDIISAYDFKLRLEYTWNHLGEKGLFLHLNTE